MPGGCRQTGPFSQVFRVTPREASLTPRTTPCVPSPTLCTSLTARTAAGDWHPPVWGSVSETYTAPAELSATTLYLREAYFRQVASDFLLMQRGVRHG